VLREPHVSSRASNSGVGDVSMFFRPVPRSTAMLSRPLSMVMGIGGGRGVVTWDKLLKEVTVWTKKRALF
jgi:hypothetical protein